MIEWGNTKKTLCITIPNTFDHDANEHNVLYADHSFKIVTSPYTKGGDTWPMVWDLGPSADVAREVLEFYITDNAYDFDDLPDHFAIHEIIESPADRRYTWELREGHIRETPYATYSKERFRHLILYRKIIDFFKSQGEWWEEYPSDVYFFESLAEHPSSEDFKYACCLSDTPGEKAVGETVFSDRVLYFGQWVGVKTVEDMVMVKLAFNVTHIADLTLIRGLTWLPSTSSQCHHAEL